MNQRDIMCFHDAVENKMLFFGNSVFDSEGLLIVFLLPYIAFQYYRNSAEKKHINDKK